jgi:hypothetical protein
MSRAKATRNGTRKRPSPSSVAASFADAYALWVAACAGIAAINADVDATDTTINRANEQLIEAEWRLVRTPANTLADVRERASAVQVIFTCVDTYGEPTDNRHLAMLAALVADISGRAVQA